MSPSDPAGPPSYKSSDMSPSEPSRPIHPMYVVDPETHTEALPYRPSHPTSLEKIYRRACCGSPGGILLWILGLLAAVIVPIVVLYARGNLSHNGAANATPVAAAETTTPSPSTLMSTVTDTAPASTPSQPSTTTSTFLTISTTTTTLTSISTDTSLTSTLDQENQNQYRHVPLAIVQRNKVLIKLAPGPRQTCNASRSAAKLTVALI
ncbi:hypothetical protein ABEF95_003533 [Exophiala dermatitidis]